MATPESFLSSIRSYDSVTVHDLFLWTTEMQRGVHDRRLFQESFFFFYVLNGAREMTQFLGAHTWTQFPAFMAGGSWPPMTDCSDPSGHLYLHIHTQIHSHKRRPSERSEQKDHLDTSFLPILSKPTPTAPAQTVQSWAHQAGTAMQQVCLNHTKHFLDW